MKLYPSIPGPSKWRPGTYHLYEKLDGSNIRVEWDSKNGFHKWGRRHGLLDDSNPHLKKAPPIFMAKYGVQLDRIFRAERYQEVTVFFEFFGTKSFAGTHYDDDAYDVVVFDISIYKKGMMKPADFEKLLRGKVDLPNLVDVKPVGINLISELQNLEADKIVAPNNVGDAHLVRPRICEGVVLKSANYVFKVKRLEWLDALKGLCGENEFLFQTLA